MKKIVQGIICLAVAGVMAAGGYMFGLKAQRSNITNAVPKQSAAEEEKSENNKNERRQENQQNDSGKYIGKSDASAAAESWSVVDKYSVDITGDGKEDTVTLYTSAESENGEIIWDDTQKWVLEIYDGTTYYTLMNQSISNGNVYFDVVQDGDNIIVDTYTITFSQTQIKQYSYNKTGFVEKQIYSSSGVNNMYSSFPVYR